jgi:hypothetical protein
MELVAAIEGAFGITLPAEDVFEMSHYRGVREVVERRLTDAGVDEDGAPAATIEDRPVVARPGGSDA